MTNETTLATITNQRATTVYVRDAKTGEIIEIRSGATIKAHTWLDGSSIELAAQHPRQIDGGAGG